MAATSATITVNFVSNYSGTHRICWRQGGSGAYNCSTTVSCTGGGASCSATISVTVDNETCSNVEFDGYVQAACEDINSTNGRVPFNRTFTPTPNCTRWVATCASAGIGSIAMTNNGSGYAPAPPPSVNFTGGGGTGAAGTAVVGTGKIKALAITSGGSGYTNGTYTNVSLLGGTGASARGTVVISGGAVTSVTVTNQGTGYTTGDTLAPDTTVVGVPVVAAALTVTSDLGTITGVTVTAPGSGYTSAPAMTIASPPSGTTATGTVTLAYCSDINASDCDQSSGAGTIHNKVIPGETVALCKAGSAPTVPSDYTIAQSGNCLCSCTSTTIQATGGIPGSVNYTYNACNGNFVSGTLTVGGSPSSITVCAVTGSVTTEDVDSGVAVVTTNGACSA